MRKVVVMGALAVIVALTLAACGGGEVGQVDTFELNGVTMRSHLVDVEMKPVDGEPYTLRWHYVEAGKGEPIVFIHGLPESWYSWHNQIESLQSDHRVIAIDLKGYGQSDKPDGDYHPRTVAAEIMALLDRAGVQRFNLVTHDWGTLIGDYVAGGFPDRIIRYVRMEAPVLKMDPANHPQFALFVDQEFATNLLSDADRFVRGVYASRTVQPLPEDDLTRIIEEFGREGVAEAVPRYFRDFFGSPGAAEGRADLFSAMDFPVLLLQADRDPAQPLWYFDGATDLFQDATFQTVKDSGHFSELEQPEAVSEAIRDFLQR
ncbi:MAG TPA: alpha/beta fold hydrolase [Thermoleophilia bacterium]|nr:alpha/beta fold hydrolase [Thermoleophilia bacterium]